ncbi:hypothetical protein GHT06_021338 [Daphnia sinensis]|uniref:MULE transposase domain-containing protein n=1 Tax=Daphnia sinensis TaxID=1820382 RepID=A0AAD5KK91_9CRUS|nr:hypothetical protein GHT06_021338 [Daphnia sinensis]
MGSLQTPQTVEDASMPANLLVFMFLVAMAEAVEEVRQHIRVTVVPGTRKNSYRYNTECGFIFYKKDMRLIGCHCKITMRDGVFTQTGAHNHDAQFEEQHRAAAVNECLDLARAPRMGRQGPKRIVEIARSVHREARIALNPALERRIQREKRSNQPFPPTSIDDMIESMAYHPVFNETIRGDLFFHGTVRSDEDDDVPGVGLIFLSLLLLGQLGEATSMHLDGTFHTVPTLFYQLLTIHVVVHNKAFPVAFVLMTRKTRHLYTSVLRFIIRMYEDRFPEAPCTITDIVTDFELALMGAVSDVMDVESRGCWFHYGQAIIRKSGMLHLNRNYRRGGAVAHIIQEIIGLALLPAEKIYEGFEDIRRSHRRRLALESRETQQAMNSLYAYWTGYWLGTVTPERFSCNGKENRTNNFVESWHRWFNKRCVHSHLNVWDFIDELKEAEESKSRDFLTAENGHPIGRGSTPAQRKRNRRITRNSSLLEDGYLTIREFLERTRKTFNVPLPAEDEAAEDELNEEEAPEDRQSDVSNEDIADVPFRHGRQRFRAGVRLTERQRRAMERRNRAVARHNRREMFENLPPRNETPPPASPNPDSPPARVNSPPARLDSPPARLDSPPARLDSPPARLDSPPARLDSPPARLDSPPARLDSPWARLDSPWARLDSPPARLDSPPAHPATPPTHPDTPPFPVRPLAPLVSPFRPEAPEIHPASVTQDSFRSMASPAALMSADTSPRQVRQRHRKKYLRIRPLRSIDHDPERILEQRLLALRANRVSEHDEPRVLIREEIVAHQRRAVARNPSPPNI